MQYEVYGRVCVGAPLTPEAAAEAYADFLAQLALPTEVQPDALFARLREETPRHKLHEPDRVRYERALEAFLDTRWDVDFALGGLCRDGVLDLRRGYLFVGVRIEQFETVATDLGRGAATPERPQWLRKGDLSPGSELAKQLGSDARKPFEHACRMYARAAREILRDATARVRKLPIVRQHEPDWALCRWVLPAEHPAALHRHGGRARER